MVDESVGTKSNVKYVVSILKGLWKDEHLLFVVAVEKRFSFAWEKGSRSDTWAP
jgi:hypothetical protein